MIKNEEVVSKLVSDLPSFYSEFLYDPKLIQTLFDAYVDVFEHMTNEVKSVYYNTCLDKAEILRSINKGVLTLSKSLYDVNKVSAAFASAGNGDWFSSATTLKSKILFLESLGHFEILDANRVADTNLRDVVDLVIAKDFSESMGYYTNYEDYVVVNNTLFLFNDLAKPVAGNVKKVLAKDILVDYRKIDNRWGVLFESITKDYLTPFEYKEFIQALLVYSPTVSKMKGIIQNLMSKGGGDLYDSHVRKNVPEEFLLSPPQNLKPFDFIFKIPPELLEALFYIPSQFIDETSTPLLNSTLYKINYKNQDNIDPTMLYYTYLRGRIKNIRNFLNFLRPAYTNFLLEGTIYFGDDLSDIITDTVSLKTNLNLHITDSLGAFLYDLNTYDSGEYEGDNGEWDSVSVDIKQVYKLHVVSDPVASNIYDLDTYDAAEYEENDGDWDTLSTAAPPSISSVFLSPFFPVYV